jgi:peptide/nickel transport system substrate-binding protein
MRIAQRGTLVAVLLVVLLVFSMAPTLAQTPKRGGTINVGILAPISRMDPHTAPNQPAFWTIGLIYSYLVQYDKDLQLRPDLATSWERPDPRTHVFRLRRGVKFHNGREVTSTDVKYSIERIMDPRTGSSRRLRYASVERVEAPDPTTVVFRLRHPDNILPYLLADPASAIVPREVVEREGDLQRVAIGSGPFMLERLTADGGAVLVRNPDYYERGKPYVDRVNLRNIPDNSARMTAVRTGDIDIATFLVTQQLPLLRRDPSVIVTDGLSGQYYFLALNARRPPYNDMKVRQAVAWALDRDTLVRVALAGEGFPLNAGPLPPWHWAGMKTPIFRRNLDRAKQLLSESSATRGFTLTIRVWASQDFVIDAVALIQQQLEPLGIRVQMEQQADWSTYWNPVLQGDYEATIQGFGGNAHPDDWLYERFRTGGGSNYGAYSNPKVDDLLLRSRVAPTPERQAELYAQVQQIIAEEAAVIFLWNMKQATAHRADVKGYYHMPTLTLPVLKDTWLDR